MPSNLISFIKFFDLNIFNLFPSVLEFDETDLKCNLHPILIEKELKCLGINNISDLLCQLFMLFIFKLVMAGLAFLVKERPKQNPKVKAYPDQSPESDTNRINHSRFSPPSKKEIKIPKKSCIGKTWNLVKVSIVVINNKMDYSFYWAVLMSMEIDLFIGSWSTLKAYSTFSAP